MKYLIDITMIYCSDVGIIKIKGEEEQRVRLSKQASRLLHELIINNKHALERNYLIFKVWEQYGCAGSSISLNVAISEIRKAFRQLHSDPMLIKTLRGVGFMLSADIDYLSVEHISEHSQKADREPQHPAAVNPVANSKMSLRNCPHWSLALAGTCILITAVVIGMLINENEWLTFKIPDVNMALDDNDASCSLLKTDSPLEE